MEVDEIYPLARITDKEENFYFIFTAELKRMNAKRFTLRNRAVVPVEKIAFPVLITSFEQLMFDTYSVPLRDDWIMILKQEIDKRLLTNQ